MLTIEFCHPSRSVNDNQVIGGAAEQLARVVLDHSMLTNFGGIPMDALRENKLTELNLNGKGIGVPGALVLAALLPGATALKSCRCVAAPCAIFPSLCDILGSISLLKPLMVCPWQLGRQRALRCH